MANLLYLIVAVAISALLSWVLWMRNRKPRSTEAGIDSFQKGLRALAPDKSPPESERPHSG